MSQDLAAVARPVRTGRLSIRPATVEDLPGLFEICFEDLGLRRVKALAFADNLASRRVMEKLGMRLEEYAVAESLHRSKGWLDGAGYAILADEWRARA